MNDIEEMLKDISHKAMLYFDKQDMKLLIHEYDIFMGYVTKLENVDTTNIEPLIYPYDKETLFLRNDEDIHVLTCEDILKNAPKTKNNYIQVPKVMK